MNKEDSDVMSTVKVIAALILLLTPLLFKVAWLYLALKRKSKKKRRIFRKTMKKEGMDKETIDALCSEMEDISLREFIGNLTENKRSIPLFNRF